MIDKMQGFKNACVEVLDAFSLMQLRVYGRSIGVDVPTKKKKGELIEGIVAVLCGEATPIERSTRGAPVKDDHVDPAIEQAVAKQRYIWFARVEKPVRLTYIEAGFKNKNMLMVQSSDNAMTFEQYHAQPIYAGQLEVIDGVPCLVDKNGDLDTERLTVSIELIRQYGLREGDVITCHAHEKMGVWAAKNILTINSLVAGTEKRFIFEEEAVGYPTKQLPFLECDSQSAIAKILDYTLPIGCGHRCVIASAPKAGKSSVLRDLAKTLYKQDRKRFIFTLLIDQSLELISSYQQFVPKGDLVATSFEDDAEKHVFAAEFLLKRAKRYAEHGREVILLVDSLSKIAKAYNEIEDSAGGKTLPCGLETKTLHYLKKYFGAARSFASGGSLTILGTASFGTGDAADDVISSELSTISNAEIRLSEELAKRRVFPSVDVAASNSDGVDTLFDMQQRKAEADLRLRIASGASAEAVIEMVVGSNNFDEFAQKVGK